MEETKDTQSAANELTAAAARVRGKTVNTTLGIVRCQQGRTYAGHSGSLQREDIQAEMPSDWHAPALQDKKSTATKSYMDRFLVHIKDKNKANFVEAWKLAEQRNAEYNQRTSNGVEPYFLPGGCAAPKLVALALQHGCHPVGLTERKYRTPAPDDKGVAKVEVFYRTSIKAAPQLGSFGGNKGVPPCGSCQIILTMLMCPDECPPQCSHQSPGQGVCKIC